MTLHNKIGFIFVAMALFAVCGCSGGNDVYLGTWRRIPEGDSLYRGFTLGTNGIAASMNETTTQYNGWHHKGDRLLLSGQRFTDTTVAPFTDTLIVKKITADSLVVSSKGEILHFSRE